MIESSLEHHFLPQSSSIPPTSAFMASALSNVSLPSHDASRRKRNRRKMAAERLMTSSGGSSGGNRGGGGSAVGPEENKENEKPKAGALGDSLGLESILPLWSGWAVSGDVSLKRVHHAGHYLWFEEAPALSSPRLRLPHLPVLQCALVGEGVLYWLPS